MDVAKSIGFRSRHLDQLLLEHHHHIALLRIVAIDHFVALDVLTGGYGR